MKRHGNLWHQVIDFDNLLAAARKAQRGKRYQENVMRFNDRLSAEVISSSALRERVQFAFRRCGRLHPKIKKSRAAW